jgi:hypothetical protein
MERGRLCWPEPSSSGNKVQLSHEQFAMLIGGIDLTQTRERKWYRKVPGQESGKLLKSA